jgi:hypothetical protein
MRKCKGRTGRRQSLPWGSASDGNAGIYVAVERFIIFYQ